MTKSDLLNVSKKYLIASADLAEKIHSSRIEAIALPAFESDVEYSHFAFLQDEDALHIQLFDKNRALMRQVKSHYTVDNYVYVREPYWIDADGSMKYFADFNPGFGFVRARVTPGKYMKKIYARSFLHITSVSCKLMSELTAYELSSLGFKSILDYLDFYDEQLGEKRYEAYRSYKNPYIFYYEFEALTGEN